MEKIFDIIGIGSAVVDDLIILPDFPTQNTKISVLQRKKQVGGDVPMALKTLTGFGLSSSFIGKIGSDEDSLLIKKYLKESGIDVSNLIEERDTKSPYAQVWINISNGTRTIAVDSGSAPVLRERNIDFNALPEAKMAHIDGKEHDISKKIVRHYKEQGAKISIDTGSFRERTLELFDLADIIMMPLSFAMDWLGKHNFVGLISNAGIKYPDKLIVITDGQMGSVCSYKGEIMRQKAFRVNCVDSTGSGGVFSGGILYGEYKGWDPDKTLGFAAATAAINCTKLGNTDLPTLAEVEELLAGQ